MRKAQIFVNGISAGILEEGENEYVFTYHSDYQRSPISLTMPVKQSVYKFKQFPTFFEGLLPEGDLLTALLQKYKLDKKDYFGQLLEVGKDVVGAVTIEELR